MCSIQNMLNNEHVQYVNHLNILHILLQYAYSTYSQTAIILHIDNFSYRTRHCLTHCVCKNSTPRGGTLAFIQPSWLGMQNILVRCTFLVGRWHERYCSRLTAKTDCSSARLKFPKALFSSELIISGSVNCFCCSRLKPRPMQGWKSTRVPLFLCWRSTKATDVQVCKFCILCILWIHIIFCIFCIFGILCILWSDCLQDGWMPASQPSSTSAVKQLKSCMLFQCPPYWGGFLLSSSATLERSPSRCEGNQLTFREQVVIRHRAAVTDVGGGMWTAGPCHGGPSNKHCWSKKWNTAGKDSFFMHMQNMQNMY
jgi:hypothetical protein